MKLSKAGKIATIILSVIWMFGLFIAPFLIVVVLGLIVIWLVSFLF